MVTLTIDRKTVTVPEGTTILEAARSVHLDIPTLCYLKGVNEIGACRLCMVEVEGYERLVPACDNAIVEGMVVSTNSPRVREARRVNLRLLLSQHDTNCTKCTRSGNCKLQQLSNDYNLLGEHYIQDLNHIPDDFSNPVIRIENRCVKCYEFRLYEAARQAKEGGFDSFTSSLFISPYQKHELMREVAERAASEYGVEFLYRDFRPYFRAGQERARELGFYIQKYCGCVFSEEERYLKKSKIIP